MKKKHTISLAVLIGLAVAACSGGGKQPQQQGKDEIVENNSIERDSTVFGICGEGSAMNTMELILDSGDTLSVCVTYAQDADMVFGGYAAGDRMAVMPRNGYRDTARIVINVSTLMGEWLMPNPLDGSSEMGFRIKEGGIVDGIEQPSVIYKTWKIYNGKLEMVTQREGGSQEEEVTFYDVLMLGPDTLIIKDKEDTYNYGRIHEEGKHRLINFEETPEDEFML